MKSVKKVLKSSDLKRRETRDERESAEDSQRREISPGKTWKLEKLAPPENGLAASPSLEWFCIFLQSIVCINFPFHHPYK